MKKCRKAASILLSVMIILGLMPMSVFADPEGENPSSAPTNADQIGNYYEVNDVTGELPGAATLAAGSTQQSYADGQVFVNKTIKAAGKENLFNINLEVTTKNKIEQRALSPDAAVVLVIDVSRSMEGDRLENAKTAAQTFINSFASDDDNVHRKVAIVKFSGWKDKNFDGATTVQSWTDASELKRDGNVKCESIQNLNIEGGTNIEAGLYLAKNLLKDETLAGITNKNVVLLTDGKPTYGMGTNAYTSSSDAICPRGRNMIGDGQNTTHTIHGQVESIARSFGNDINRYAIFVGNDNISCTDGWWGWTTCDLARYSGKPVSTWLRNDCGFTTMSTTDAGNLTQLFESIIEMIEIQAQAWILTDPMGEYIDVVNPELADYNSETREIVWDLKNAGCVPSTDGDGNITYTYSRSYQVRLNNLKPGFVAGQEYPANSVTSLTYTISQSSETETPKLQTAYFNIPSVKGFAGDLAFTKVDESEHPLAGAGFTLKAEDGDFSMTACSGTDGNVSFANIPSGHTYTLEETTVPTGYHKANDETIGVAFGVVSGLGTGATIVNKSEKTNVTVNKIWEDNNNQAGKRPGSIDVQLYANGEKCGDPVTIKAPQTQAGNAEGTVQTGEEGQKPGQAQDPEVTTPEQGNEDQTNADQAEVVETPESDAAPADADADKAQEPAVTDDQPQPADTEMQALSEEVTGEVSEKAAEPEPAQSIDSAPAAPAAVVNEWTHTWYDLPRFENGQEITYTVEEVALPAGYISEIVSNGNTITITNKYMPDTTSYTVEKTWHDADNQDGLRPDSIKVQLLANGTACGEPVELTAGTDGKWTHTWEGLQAFDGGTAIKYTVDEVETPAGYTKTVSGNSIINTHTPATAALYVEKIWNDDDDQAGERPASVTVDILKNGKDVVRTLTLSGEGNQWYVRTGDLPKYENGEKIVYTAVERPVPHYTCNIEENDTDRFIITNTYSSEISPETVAIPVSKVWADNNNAAGKRPESITVNVMNGDTVAMTVTLNESNSWSATVMLPKTNSDGQEIEYTVKEVRVVNYESSIAGDMNGFTITNAYKAPEIPVYPPYTPPYIPPVVPTPGPVDPQLLPPDDPLIEDPDKPIVNPQPLPPDDPLIVDEASKQPLPKDEHLADPDQPKTGDEAPLMALTGLFLVSAGALGAVYIRRRREK